MENSKNINWINVVKALCIIFVFLRHSEDYYGCFWGNLDFLYLTIYVNGFFFISGYLIYRKQLSMPSIAEDRLYYIGNNGGGKKMFINIIFRIAVPSVLFAAIEFIPSCIIQGREISVVFAIYKTIGGGRIGLQAH